MNGLNGRCTNTEACSTAKAHIVIGVPVGSSFVCPTCGSPLSAFGGSRNMVQGIAKGVAVFMGVSAFGLAAVEMVEPFTLAHSVTRVQDWLNGNPVQVAAAPAAATPQPPAPGAVFTTPPQPRPAAPPAPPVAAIAAPPPVAASAVAPAVTLTATSTAAPAAAVVEPLGDTILLRLAGSETMGRRLARRMAAGYLSLIGDSEIAVAATDRLIEVSGLQTGQREVITIAAGSSASGFTALLRGSADFAMSVRRIQPAEAERLVSLGDLVSPQAEAVIGMQGIAAVVSPANRLQSITIPQLRAVLAGRVKDWSELGGVPGPINVYLQDNQGGAIDVPQDVLISSDDPVGPVSKISTEEALVAAVATDRGGIGLTTFGNTGNTKVLAVAEAGVPPVMPNDLTISTESYPLSRRLYLYTSPLPTNQFVRRFASFVGSVGGQAVIEAAGVVPLTVRAERASVPDAASERFRQFVSGAARLSVDFRFQPGTVALDSRSIKDLDRLVAFLKTQHVNPNRVILAGFADNAGAPAANQITSQRRTEVVVAALNKAGVPPGKAAMFGAELPVADNSTPEGRERNRRVEIYLAP